MSISYFNGLPDKSRKNMARLHAIASVMTRDINDILAAEYPEFVCNTYIFGMILIAPKIKTEEKFAYCTVLFTEEERDESFPHLGMTCLVMTFFDLGKKTKQQEMIYLRRPGCNSINAMRNGILCRYTDSLNQEDCLRHILQFLETHLLARSPVHELK